MSRTGIFGGTFNPIHIGHVEYARFVCEKLSLDRLLIIPAEVSPFKVNSGFCGVGDEDRLNMCRQAFNEPHMIVSDTELKRGGVSYSADTVDEIKRMYPDDELFMFIGTDQLMSFDRWQRYWDILKNATLVCVWRDVGCSKTDAHNFVEEKLARYGKVIILDFKPINISSTEVRERIKNGQSVKGLVPDVINEYILKRGLYR